MEEQIDKDNAARSKPDEVGCGVLLTNGVKFTYWSNERAYLAKYVGDDDHYGAEQLRGGAWVPVVYQDDGWQADYVDGVYVEFSEAVEAAWDYLS